MAGPNFVFILLDDLGWMDLGCQGSSFYETPSLDLLAREGVRFTDAYASCPVCSPTRASIMTGKYPATVRITNFIAGEARGKLLSAPYLHYLPLEEKTIASALRDSGYATWHVGKWHLGGEPYWPENHGFDVNVGGCSAGMPKSYFSPYRNPKLPDGPEGEYLTDRLTDEAIALIRRHSAGRRDRPFFLNLWYYQVHIPIQGKPEHVGKYEAKARALGLEGKDPFAYGEHFPCEHKKDGRITRRLFQGDPGYAAMVQSVDENVGRLLRTLEEEGIAGDTVVFFTSDNGGLSTAEGSPTSNAPLSEGKGWMYEGGTREPLIVRWPGVTKPDSLCTVPVTSTDFYPTMLEAAGLSPMPEQHVDGTSIVPLLRNAHPNGALIDEPGLQRSGVGEHYGRRPFVRSGPAERRGRTDSCTAELGGAGRTAEPLLTGRLDREAIFWHYPHYSNQGGTPGCSVRSGDHKLIEFFEDGHVELYNLREDVGEERDIAEAEPEVASRLRAALHDWLERVEAKIPEPNPDYAGTCGDCRCPDRARGERG